MNKILQDLNLGTGTYSSVEIDLNEIKTGDEQFIIFKNTLIVINEQLARYYKAVFDSSIEQMYQQNLTEAGQESKSIVNKKYKIKDLRMQYKREIEESSSCFSVGENILESCYMQVEDLIISLNYERISFECTPDSSFFFNIIMNKSIKVHIEIYIEDSTLIEKKAFFNIFENRKSVKTGYGKIIDIVREINYYSG